MRRYLVVGAIVVSTVLAGSVSATAAPAPPPPGCEPADHVLTAGPGGSRPGAAVSAPGEAREPVSTARPGQGERETPPAAPAPLPDPDPLPESPALPTPAPQPVETPASAVAAPTMAPTPAPDAPASPSATPAPGAPASPSATPAAAPTPSAAPPAAAAPAAPVPGPAAATLAGPSAQAEQDELEQDRPADDPARCAGRHPGMSAGHETSAAYLHGWGEPNRVDEFDAALGDQWNVYDGPGHAGNGRRTPGAVTVENGMLTITGDPHGNTAGMAWNPGQRYGRWEGRVKAPASDESYNALLLLWPDAEDFPVGGEIDFMEMMDHTRQKTNIFLHYGEDNDQVSGEVHVDATEWHNWAVEWTPTHVAAFVDGKEWWRTTNVDILPPRPMHLCIQLDWFPEDGNGDVAQSHMYVDWVKQYPIDAGDVVAGTAEDALRIVENTLGGVTEGVGDIARGVVGGVTGQLTEGGPDPEPVPSRRGLVDHAVRAGG